MRACVCVPLACVRRCTAPSTLERVEHTGGGLLKAEDTKLSESGLLTELTLERASTLERVELLATLKTLGWPSSQIARPWPKRLGRLEPRSMQQTPPESAAALLLAASPAKVQGEAIILPINASSLCSVASVRRRRHIMDDAGRPWTARAISSSAYTRTMRAHTSSTAQSAGPTHAATVSAWH